MVEEHVDVVDVDDTCFLDTDIDSFRSEPLVVLTNKAPTPFSQEVKC